MEIQVNTWPIERVLRPLFRRFSLLGDNKFFATDQFRPTRELEQRWTEILDEFELIRARIGEFAPFQDISPDQTFISNDDKWKMFFLMAGTIRFERNCQQFPVTMSILGKYPEVISAYFSVIGPNKMLTPHEGPWSGVLRMHLGLIIPQDGKGCSLVVGGDEYRWAEGEVVAFDDTYEHFAINLTDHDRVILFLDIKRPLPYLLDKLNSFVVWTARFLPYFRVPLRRHRAWERRFYRN